MYVYINKFYHSKQSIILRIQEALSIKLLHLKMKSYKLHIFIETNSFYIQNMYTPLINCFISYK